jgi:hypothetical protein
MHAETDDWARVLSGERVSRHMLAEADEWARVLGGEHEIRDG